MKILLDENMPAKVDYDFGQEREVYSVRQMNWLGKKNGELLGLAAFNGFDAFVTLDKNLRNQQNLDRLQLKFILLFAFNNKPATIAAFVPKIRELLNQDTLPKLSEIH